MTWDDPLVQTVLPGVHRAPVPLPEDGLRAVNVYVVEDGDGVTLIDAGWDSPVARAAVQAGLDAAGAGIADVNRILVTHVHYDHVGQATALRRAGAREWWLGEAEKGTFTSLTTDPVGSRMSRLAELRRYGAGRLVDAGMTRADGPDMAADWDVPDRWSVEGDEAPLADGALEVIDTPGHTLGHQCFLHRGRRLLFAGDHVLPHITPSIGLESVVNRLSLADFMASLAKVRNLDVDLVLPAHGEVFSDLPGRVDALIDHHDGRLAACVEAVGSAPTTAYDVAQILTWTRRDTPFDQLNRFNQVLATWETAAHLELLHARGDLSRDVVEEIVIFAPPRG